MKEKLLAVCPGSTEVDVTIRFWTDKTLVDVYWFEDDKRGALIIIRSEGFTVKEFKELLK
jgi:hypothetical protein